jgi:hypothetical protein
LGQIAPLLLTLELNLNPGKVDRLMEQLEAAQLISVNPTTCRFESQQNIF